MAQQHAAIFIGGDTPTHVSWIRQQLDATSLIIAADSGWAHAVSCGYLPHVLIGDMDSIASGDLEQARSRGSDIVTFDHDKDFTDAELALSHARSRGAARITVISGGGDRFDHLIALIHSLVPIAESGIEIEMLCGDTTIHIMSAHQTLSLTCERSEVISLIPLGGDARDVTTSGLQWNLAHETLSIRASRGVSNRATRTTVEISLGDGALAVMRPVFAASLSQSIHQGETS